MLDVRQEFRPPREERLWILRREWGDTYHTRFYCRERFPNEDNSGGGGRRQSRVVEVACPSCFLKTLAGEDCTNCGASLHIERSEESVDGARKADNPALALAT